MLNIRMAAPDACIFVSMNASARSPITAARLRAVIAEARRAADAAKHQMRQANRAQLRALLTRDDAAALAAREAEQAAKADLQRARAIITAAVEELAAMSTGPMSTGPNFNERLLLEAIREAVSA